MNTGDIVVPQDISGQLLHECLGRPACYAALEELCDRVGCRMSGSEGGQRAEQWAHDRFLTGGLSNVRFEAFPVTVWTRGTLDVSIGGPCGWVLSALAHGYSPRRASVTASVMDMRFGEREDFECRKTEVAGQRGAL